jgi:SAM-dependent methyltransferase
LDFAAEAWSSPGQSRARFLSSTAAAFLSSAAVGAVEQCQAASWIQQVMDQTAAAINSGTDDSFVNSFTNNPRYLDQELQMKFGDGPDGNPRTRGVLVRRITGDATPFEFPVREVSLVKEWPETPPFSPEDFFRADSNDDGWFYTVPKLVYHIDEPAVASLTQYYRNNIPKGSNILDICSSWVSHYPLEFPDTMKNICATGINPLELQFNDQLTGGYKAADLNKIPKLPYDDNSFDVVTCVVSIDYLVDPVTVLKEVHRVLRPGGQVIVSQSNRCFPSKAIAMWLKMNDRQHLELINAYFQYAGGFQPRQAFDITATMPDNSYRDPMFIVKAIKA